MGTGKAAASKDALPRLDLSGDAPAAKTEEVTLKSWGATVVIRSLTGADYDSIPRLSADPSEKERIQYEASYISAALVEPKASAGELVKARKDRAIADWFELYSACLRLAAPGEEELRTAQEEFQDES